jgi:hypothetical protein
MKNEKYIPGRSFKIDADKIKTLEDVKAILEYMNLNFTPTSREAYEKTKHLLKDSIK